MFGPIHIFQSPQEVMQSHRWIARPTVLEIRSEKYCRNAVHLVKIVLVRMALR